MNILVVEDEPKALSVVRAYLERDGHRVLEAMDGERALLLFETVPVDFVILDLMLPDICGEEVCRRIRASSQIPIIILTAKAAEADRLKGLEGGADDYLVKPFSPRELVARVNAVLRRVSPLESMRVLRFSGGLSIHLEEQGVFAGKRQISLTPAEYRLLLTMARRPLQAFTREQLIARAFDESYEGCDRVIDVHIKNLRQKIEQDPRHPLFIQTIFGTGYRFGGTIL
ncbi:MAG: response regulator transcription factor [Thermovirgaceae bacterium]|nr:response regulator transcription factor [Thermovirgaceae bacterium]